MAEAATATLNKPAWVDLATTDPAAARAFYAKVFGWNIEVNPDPQYGGYALAKVGGKDVAGIGGISRPTSRRPGRSTSAATTSTPSASRVTAAGGKVIAPAFDVGDQGRMAVFQDPSGAFISAWQATRMRGFQTEGANAFGWAEVNARGVDKVVPFYEQVFGWTPKTTGSPEQPYTEFQVDGQSIGGRDRDEPDGPGRGPELLAGVLHGDDVDASHRTALAAGARELVAPMDFPGGRMSIVNDPQGAAFGLLTVTD